jgi:hypothetical protein
MQRETVRNISVAMFAMAIIFVCGSVQSSQPKLRWYKGNTHTHTVNSDGDSTPDEVVRWYREHGYHFVVLTDHTAVFRWMRPRVGVPPFRSATASASRW